MWRKPYFDLTADVARRIMKGGFAPSFRSFTSLFVFLKAVNRFEAARRPAIVESVGVASTIT
jgi:hypothetical protein